MQNNPMIPAAESKRPARRTRGGSEWSAMHFLNVVPFFPDDPAYMAQQARRIAGEVGLRAAAFCIRLLPEGTPARKKAEIYAA
jgi:hypothetical protein